MTGETKEIKNPVYFIKNNTGRVVSENKPGVGTFIIQPGMELKVEDLLGEQKTPEGKVLPYIREQAKAIALAIIQDYQQPGLELVIKDASEVDEVKVEEPKKEEPKKDPKKEEDPKKETSKS